MPTIAIKICPYNGLDSMNLRDEYYMYSISYMKYMKCNFGLIHDIIKARDSFEKQSNYTDLLLGMYWTALSYGVGISFEILAGIVNYRDGEWDACMNEVINICNIVNNPLDYGLDVEHFDQSYNYQTCPEIYKPFTKRIIESLPVDRETLEENSLPIPFEFCPYGYNYLHLLFKRDFDYTYYVIRLAQIGFFCIDYIEYYMDWRDVLTYTLTEAVDRHLLRPGIIKRQSSERSPQGVSIPPNGEYYNTLE